MKGDMDLPLEVLNGKPGYAPSAKREPVQENST